ncbi:MAG: TonB-dependent receptor [Rhizomicrobium sp.]
MISFQRMLLLGASAAAICSAATITAYAQDAGTVETVTVTGIRESLRDSLIMKQNSQLITEDISTKDLGELPDITVGEELNRLPGVNTQRDRGNASEVAIRGLGPRFVFGLVNGREVASSEPDQNVRYESYPSEILSAVQVYKTQDASLIGGGIAATIDIRTTSPLDYNGSPFQIRLGPSYNTEGSALPHYDPVGFRGGMAFNYHLSDNFAVSLAASVQRQKNGFTNLVFWTEDTNQPDTGWGSPANITGNAPTKIVTLPDGTTALTGGNPAPWGATSDVRLLQQDRYGLAGAAEWRATSKLTIKADGLWSSYVIAENQLQQYDDSNGQVWPNSDGLGCSATTGAINAACLNATDEYGDGGVPGGAPVANSPYLAPGASFKVDSLGHVVQANLPTGTIDVQNNIARYWQRQTLLTGGLNFAYNSGPWLAKLDLSHSEAWRNNQWLDIQTAPQSITGSGYNMQEGTAPYVTLGSNPAIPAKNVLAYPAGVDQSNDAWWTPSTTPNGLTYCNNSVTGSACNMDAGPEETRDHISAVAGDVSRDFEGSFFTQISGGMRWSQRAKTHHQWDYDVYTAGTDYNPSNTTIGANGSVLLPVGDLQTFAVKDLDVPPMLYGNFKTIAPLVFGSMKNTLPAALGGTAGNPYLGDVNWTDGNVFGANASDGFVNKIQDWKVQETSLGGYLETKFAHDVAGIPINGNLGVRVENVKTVSTGAQVDENTWPYTFSAVREGTNYTDVMPSLSVNAHIADDQLIRLGASESVSRPPLDALNTAYSLYAANWLGGTTGTGSGGNPLLKPFRADNVDLDYEWFFHEESMLAAATYYKHVMNYIGLGIKPMTVGGTLFDVDIPVNGKGGDVYGLELTFQTKFYFLPGFLSDFGVYANASFADSNIKEFHPVSNPYPMAGLAHNSDELDLWYYKSGLTARIAMKYHSSFTMVPGWADYQLDTQDSELTLDFLTSYELNDHFGLRFEALNLTDQVDRFSGARQGADDLRGSNDPNDLATYSHFGRTLMFDVSYKM